MQWGCEELSRVLAFDTSTEVIAIGLGHMAESGAGELLASRDFSAPRAAMSCLLPAVEALLADAGMRVGDLDAVAVGLGPGSFTGVRIAMATAKGLARGLEAPLWGVGTLDAVARRMAGREGLVGVVGDAMRGEVYPALFRCGQGVERLSGDTVSRPEDVAALWAGLGEAVLLTGNGLAKHREVFEAGMGVAAEFAEPGLWAPTGEALLAQLWAAPPERGSGDPAALLPVYTRLSDAEEAERRRLGTHGDLPQTGVAGPGGAA